MHAATGKPSLSRIEKLITIFQKLPQCTVTFRYCISTFITSFSV